MKKHLLFLILIALFTLAAGAASAESIKGRVGVTGRLGFIVPADSDIGGVNTSTDVGLIGGGGLIYGLTNDIALELDITHAAYGSAAGVDFDTTNISLGGQYRFTHLPQPHLVPYVGAGLDILLNDVSDGANADTVAGVHVSGGADYFLTRDLAATAELKGVIAPNADINYGGSKVGNFDPMNLSMTFGVRYFFY